MKLTITATEEIWLIDGVECRRWDGVDEQGLPCDVFVHRIGSADPVLQERLRWTLRLAPAPASMKPMGD
jgi:hypothetical protein